MKEIIRPVTEKIVEMPKSALKQTEKPTEPEKEKVTESE